jgi:hypothetical protein
MAQLGSTVREISRSSGDRLIRVSVANPKGLGFHSSTFSEAEIQSVDSIDEALSALVLRSGVKIPVALSYEQLEQKIYQPDFKNDGTVLDLRAATGEAAKPSKALAGASDAPANTNQAPAPGGKMPDGTVFAGISPDTNKPIYTTPDDAYLKMTFNEAAEHVRQLNAQKYLGHDDWHLPMQAELNVLFNNRAAIGGFNVTGSHPAGWYWSGSSYTKWYAWCQRFSDGDPNYNNKVNHLSVRCVR